MENKVNLIYKNKRIKLIRDKHLVKVLKIIKRISPKQLLKKKFPSEINLIKWLKKHFIKKKYKTNKKYTLNLI